MTFNAVPWDDTDPMLESQYRKLFAVFADRLLKIGSLSFSPSAREVTWSGAVAVFQGAVAIQSGTDTWTIPTWAGTNKRFYYGVLRYDPDNNTVTTQLVEGQLSANPSSPGIGPSGPTFRDDTGKWDLIVWRIGPAAGSGAASTLNPNDMRPRPTRVQYVHSAEMLYTWGLLADVGDIAITDDYVYRWNGTTRVRLNQQPAPVQTQSTTSITGIVSTSPLQGTPKCGTAFVAPPSGMVKITVTGEVAQSQNGKLMYLGWQLRNGSSVGSGSFVADEDHSRAISAGEAVTSGGEAKASCSNGPYLVEGLTPGADYNVHTVHWVTSGGVGAIAHRRLLVDPVPY